jgi:hypothetical protein
MTEKLVMLRAGGLGPGSRVLLHYPHPYCVKMDPNRKDDKRKYTHTLWPCQQTPLPIAAISSFMH